MHGFCHIELPTTDLEKAKNFYSELFGWQFFPIPGQDYYVFSAGEGAVGGGIQKVSKVSSPEEYTNYVEVSDIEAALKKAESLGGKTLRPKTVLPNPDWGATAEFSAPDGCRIGLWSKG